MSDPPAIPIQEMRPAPQPEIPPDQANPSYLQRVMQDALAFRSAKIGLIWIAIMAFFAVFAPFIANSNPYFIKMQGRWSAPLFASLSWIDLLLLVITFVGLGLWRTLRVQTRDKMLILLACLLLVSLIYWWFGLGPPQNVVYGKYRDAAKAGNVQFVLNAPIPYSPLDHMWDLPEHRLLPPSRQHFMGTDLNGGDVCSRMVHACRIALAMGFVASGIAVTIGVIVGGMMGFFSGIVDILGMRLIEIFEAIPTLFLMIALVAFFSGESYRLMMLMAVIGVTTWTGYARFIRADFLSLRARDFVQAAQAAGLPLRSVLFRHMLPNGITAVVINLSFGIAGAIVYETVLSFLNLGLIDQPSWGSMLSQALGAGGDFLWWMAIFPGSALFLTVFAYVLLGEAVNDVLDPQRKKTA